MNRHISTKEEFVKRATRISELEIRIVRMLKERDNWLRHRNEAQEKYDEEMKAYNERKREVVESDLGQAIKSIFPDENFEFNHYARPFLHIGAEPPIPERGLTDEYGSLCRTLWDYTERHPEPLEIWVMNEKWVYPGGFVIRRAIRPSISGKVKVEFIKGAGFVGLDRMAGMYFNALSLTHNEYLTCVTEFSLGKTLFRGNEYAGIITDNAKDVEEILRKSLAGFAEKNFTNFKVVLDSEKCYTVEE